MLEKSATRPVQHPKAWTNLTRCVAQRLGSNAEIVALRSQGTQLHPIFHGARPKMNGTDIVQDFQGVEAHVSTWLKRRTRSLEGPRSRSQALELRRPKDELLAAKIGT